MEIRDEEEGSVKDNMVSEMKCLEIPYGPDLCATR